MKRFNDATMNRQLDQHQADNARFAKKPSAAAHAEQQKINAKVAAEHHSVQQKITSVAAKPGHNVKSMGYVHSAQQILATGNTVGAKAHINAADQARTPGGSGGEEPRDDHGRWTNK